MKILRYSLALLLLSGLAFAEPAAPRSAKDEESYSAKITERASKIVQELALKEERSASAVTEALLVQYRALDRWQRENEARAKELKQQSRNPDKALAAKAADDLKQLYASRKALREVFLAKLGAVLTPEQVEQVKDLMTYHKVRVTFNAYCQQNPGLKDEHKAKILAWLKEARAEAIDGGSADEKSDIFNKYKGRINNYLVKEGFGKKK